MSISEQIRKMVEKNPTLSKKALGLMVFKAGLAASPESGRKKVGMVTTWKNNNGAKQTDKYVGPRLNPGRVNDYTPFHLEAQRALILSDVHIPYHNREALMMALQYGKDFGADCIVLNGDIIDCYQLSNFCKDPKERKFNEELSELHNFLSDLRENFKGEIIYKMGNHEERYERFLLTQAKDIEGITDPEGLDILSWESITHAKKYGHKIVTNKRIIKAGKLNIGHGHEFGKSIFSPVNPARGFYLRAKCSFIGGHYHQTSEHIERDLNGSIAGCWSTGCLCDLNPAYMPLNRWNLGFSAVEIEGDQFTVHNKKILHGRIV
jgi:predicted phosphodiesterase